AVACHELAAAAGTELGDPFERPMPQMRVQEVQYFLRGRFRASVRLQLEPRVLRRELELPDAASVLGAATQSDSRGGERAAGDVVVDGGEDARLERGAAQRRAPQPSRGGETCGGT